MPNPNVDFYLLNALAKEGAYRFLCRLVDKAYQLQQQIYIHASSHEEAQRVDELLWTFRDTSFIPHQQITSEYPADPMLTVTIATNKPKRLIADILFNLSYEVPAYFAEFTRIIEIVSKEEKNQSRKKYKFYKAQNCQLTLHNINES
jgi:DNA polymerase-3 subunit chi